MRHGEALIVGCAHALRHESKPGRHGKASGELLLPQNGQVSEGQTLGLSGWMDSRHVVVTVPAQPGVLGSPFLQLRPLISPCSLGILPAGLLGPPSHHPEPCPVLCAHDSHVGFHEVLF